MLAQRACGTRWPPSRMPRSSSRARAGGFLDWCKEVIDRQVKHLTRLVDDLLDVSRITRGKIQLRLQSARPGVDPSCLGRFRPSAAIRGAEPATSIPRSSPEPILSRPTQPASSRVIVNLLNQRGQVHRSGGRIDLDARLDGGHAIGSGSAITASASPRELLPHPFDPFTQGDRRSPAQRGGLGIGLTMVPKLVEMHGGTVHGRQRRARPGEHIHRSGSRPVASHPQSIPPCASMAESIQDPHPSHRR